MKWRVTAKEIHLVIYEVEANDEQEAMDAVQDGGGIVVETQYHQTLDSDDWKAERAQ